jgi:GntP family gluconate:H+ symporter
MLVVIGGILRLKLHAFLALTLGALVVAVLTPRLSIEQHAYEQRTRNLKEPKKPADPSDFEKQSQYEKQLAEYEFRKAEARRAAQAEAKESIGERIATGFGRTCAGIGILIALAAIVGECMLRSGAADSIVRSTLRVLGEKRAPVAFLSSGFLLGIPVFFDTVFYLMIPLGKAMGRALQKNYLLFILTITAGATMTHSLVPPTPGPLFVADALQVNMGLMILGGCAVGACSSTAGYCFALWANSRWVVPVRDAGERDDGSPGAPSPPTRVEDAETVLNEEPETDYASDKPRILPQEDDDPADSPRKTLPPFWLSVTPILLPVILIAGSTVIEIVQGKAYMTDNPVGIVVEALGNKNIALGLAAAIAMFMLIWQKRTSRQELGKSVAIALESAGTIILITAAGGAFGMTLQQTGIGERIQQLSSTFQIGILPLAFGVTMLVRTAQGSATVAMITAVGILGGVVRETALDFHVLYVALAIGCGSKPIAWMNDSGFWVICKMSGMTENETLKTITPMSVIMGFVGLAATMIGAKLFPLV